MALALAWKALGGRAAVAADLSAEHAARVKAAGLELRPAAAIATDGWLALDGYEFGPDYLDAAKKKAKTLVLDDYGHRERLPADVVLNPNAGSAAFPYAPTDALVLAGPRYALLRPEFAAKPSRPPHGGRPKVLVTLGGADADNVTAAVLKALAPLKTELDVVTVVGVDNPNEASLRALDPNLHRGVSDLRALMLDCDAAVVAGGVTSLECAAAGLPTVVLTLAENQAGQAEALEKAGAGLQADVSRVADAVRAVLKAPGMGAAGRALIDGRGAERVAKVLRALSMPKLGEQDARLRAATPDDMWPVWRLANEPSVRAHSFSSEPIPAEAHARWFSAQLADPKTRFYVLDIAGAVAAQVRCVLGDDGAAEVHFSVASAFRGKGLGTLALRLSKAEAPSKRLKAFVIEPNDPSSRAFLSAGYSRAGTAKQRGKDCAVFEATC